MSASRLRAAAKVLRERAATEAVLRDGDPYYSVTTTPDGSEISEASAWDLTMHPGVGLALADWLDATASTAAHLEDDLAAVAGRPDITQLVGYDFEEAITLADLILGGAS